MSSDPAVPPQIPHGRAWLDPDHPHTLHLAGEIDQPVVQDPLHALTHRDLAGVDVIEMSRVTFADSSAISLVANLVLARDRRAPLAIRNPPDLAVFVLDVAGLLENLTIEHAEDH